MKGQWYIVAAVMFSFSLLTLFNVFQGYYVVDFVPVAENDEDIILMNLVDGLNQTAADSIGGSENLNGDLTEFTEMVRENLIGKGYFFDCEYSTSLGFDLKKIEIKGRNMKISYNE